MGNHQILPRYVVQFRASFTSSCQPFIPVILISAYQCNLCKDFHSFCWFFMRHINIVTSNFSMFVLELLTNLTQQNFVICYIYCVHRNNFKGYFSSKRVPVSLSTTISSNSTFGAIKPILKQQQQYSFYI